MSSKVAAPAPLRKGLRERRVIDLSILAPARDEAENLPRLIEEIEAAMLRLREVENWDLSYEIIVINDGSVDATETVLREIAADHPEVSVVGFMQSRGQSAALVAGLRLARGDWVATLDADLQNDPADLCRLWRQAKGQDAVLGWRRIRRDSASRRISSAVANGIRNAVLGQNIRDTGCALRLIKREYALRLPVFSGMHRFIGPLLLREGAKVVQMPVSHRPRLRGKSHYGLGNRFLRSLVDLVGVAWLMGRGVANASARVEEA